MLTIKTKSPYKLCSISDPLITSLLCHFGGLLKRRTLNDYKVTKLKDILEFAEIAKAKGKLKTKAKFSLSGWNDNIKNHKVFIGPTITFLSILYFSLNMKFSLHCCSFKICIKKKSFFFIR